jgi:uncharacterized protein YcnI
MMRSGVLALLLSAMLAAPAFGHVTLSPAEAAADARQVYVVRMPNEKEADTVRLDLYVPDGMTVTSLRQQPRWDITVDRGIYGRIVAAHWSGHLPSGQFAEFAVQARNPHDAGTLTWRAVQTYADGLVVEWSGEPGSRTPAPRVVIVSAAVTGDHAGH